MKTVMILPVYLNGCNVRLFSSGMRSGRGSCFARAALVSVLLTGAVRADTHYVSAARPDDSGNGLSWATAEKTIQAAVNAATAGDKIVVTNGIYAPISTENKAITLQSFNGEAVTLIDGGGTNRCATLGSSSSHTNTVLVGFTLRNGNASSSYGGGSYFGTLNNCMLTGNSASYGGGSYYGMLNNCTLSGNSASSYGGGAYESTLNNCKLSANNASNSGGGSVYGTLNNCTLTENSAPFGGGVYAGTLNNCTLLGNRAGEGGGAKNGTLNNCTLSGNRAASSGGGGGSYGGTLNNCIVWGNTCASGGANNYSAPATFSYSCTEPLPSGTGNLSADPLFRLPVTGDYRLSPGSPCLNAGMNGYAVGAVDGLGNPRIQDGTVDMGAQEGAGTLVTDGTHLARNVLATGNTNGIVVSWNPPSSGGAVLYRVFRLDRLTEQWTPVSGWITELIFLDTQAFGDVIYRYAVVSSFDTRLDTISGLSASAEGQRTLIPQFYVDASRPGDTGDGRSWATAKKTIQAAIDISASYDTILVTNGFYASISTANKAITIQSVNGMTVTVIDGGGTNRCATLGSAANHLNTNLIGFTLRNGYASYGSGSYYGTLNNCTLKENIASTSGGGSYYGMLNNCMLTGNSASTSGGGSYAGTLNTCTLTGNRASYGGGSFSVTLNNCTLSGNRASSSGGGSYFGTLNNCTFSGNSASSDGGGSAWSTLNNCIVWGNTLVSGVTNNYANSTFNYSCTEPLPSGTGNLSADPLFRLPVVGDYRLSPGSPCLNAGTNGYAVGSVDGLGNPRIQDGTVDMGAYEGAGTLVTDGSRLARNVLATGDTNGIVVSWNPPSSGGAVLYRVYRMDLASGRWTPVSAWIAGISFLDTQVFGGLVYRYVIVSAFDARIDVISGLSAPAEGQRTLTPQYYVDASRPGDMGDGRRWATAKKTIQAAIDISIPYTMILVTNGVYAPISTANKAITIQSVNGVTVTVIDGGGTNRCATLGSSSSHTDTALVGFTLRNGYVASSGGGSYCGTLNTCTLSGNSASSGGGSYYGTLNNCTLMGNSASYGGGSYYGTLNTCTLSGNSASSYGGGSYYSTLNNCTLSGNSASSRGGGSYNGTLNNCTSSGNNASSYGGGSYYSALNNCTLSGNRASEGGGSYNGTLNNCTLSGNSASSFGGGSYEGTLNNCIVWGNTCASGLANNYSGGTFSYSSSTPLPSGTGNLSADPLFRLLAAWDYRLSPGSLCLNAGSNSYAIGLVDGLGNPRIQDGTVDMGAYEGTGTLATDASFLARNLLAIGGVDAIAVSWTPPSVGGAVLYRVFRTDMVSGQWMPVSGWITELSFLDTQAFGGVIYRYAVYSAFDARLDVISGLSAPAEGQRILIPQFYVDASRPSDAGDGRGWATAKKTIQAAIAVSTSYDTILVTNGVYAPISTSNKVITIRSVNGAEVTVIDGGGTNRCATLGSESIHLNTILVGFTLRNGSASYGGGSYNGTLNNCTLSGNSASYYGGGSYYGRLNNCTLSKNSASYGGGSFYGMLNNCTLSENSASSSGGGSYNGTLNNCTLTGNSASSGGGSYGSTLNNSIVWENTLFSGAANNYSEAAFNYSCTMPLPPGTGNLSTDPLFRLPAARDFRLSPGSPCLNAGSNSYVIGSMDGLGNARIQEGMVDMGAYEGAWTLATDAPALAQNVSAIGSADGVTVYWNPPSAGGAVLYRVFRMDLVTGQWKPVSGWITELSFLDTQVFCGVLHRYAIVSAFDARLNVISGLSATAEGQRTLPQFYVDASRPSDAGDGRSWATAKRRIQAAINIATPYDTILVTNGVYAPISTANKTIKILSVNGSTSTVIDGGGTNRCATLGSTSTHLNTILIGFTLRNGYASDGAGASYGTLNNCTLSGNSSSSSGGGSYYSTLNNCTLSGNSTTSGGGSYYGTLNNCMLSGNSASYGGGAYYGTLNNCTLSGNSAFSGGGSYYGTLNNCTLSGNRASPYGGGSYYGTLNNCTLSGNSASSIGGGTYHCTVNNCIVWGNTLFSGETNNHIFDTVGYSCTTPLPSGTGNISSNPLFKDSINSNFILRAGSPCINAGSNPFVVGATDLAGNPRIVAGRVDMGAYEMPQRVTVTFDASGGLLATGQTSTNFVGYTGDLYDSWLTLSNGISRVGYTFGGWWTGANGSGTQATTTTTVTADHTLYAAWTLNTYTLTVINARGDAVPANGDQTCLYGDAVVASAPSVVTDGNTRYICAGASVDGNDFTQAGTAHVTLTLTNNAVLAWQWSTNYFLSLTSMNGLILNTEEGWKPAHSNYSLSVQADPGYTFDHWEMNGLPVGSGVPLSLTMDQAPSVIAVFRSLFMDVSSHVYWDVAWVFNPRKGYFIGTLTLTNTNAFKVLTAPFWFQVESTTNHWLRYPTGINANTGIPYLDITAAVTNQLPGTGNGDLMLDKGESVTVTGIELMGRRAPDGVVVAVWADPPGMLAKPVDTDGDGMPDVDEFIAGTSAVDPDSFFRIRLGPDGRSVQWDGKPNRVYTVLTSTNLSQGFVIEQDNIKSTGKPMTHQTVSRISEPGTSETRFYRVNVILK